MKSLRLQFGASAMALLLSGAASAVPVTFSGSATSFTPGAGYGVDAAGVETVPIGLPGGGVTLLAGGQGGTLLNVVFTATGASVTFTLSAGQSLTGVFGTVELRERYIDPAETDDLGVTADITAIMPLAGFFPTAVTGTAIVGPVPAVPPLGEAAGVVDFTIDWDPVFVPLPGGGLFSVDFADLSFVGTGAANQLGFQTLDQMATITLLVEPNGVVPEPGVLALLGLGLAGLGFSRRRAS